MPRNGSTQDLIVSHWAKQITFAFVAGLTIALAFALGPVPFTPLDERQPPTLTAKSREGTGYHFLTVEFDQTAWVDRVQAWWRTSNAGSFSFTWDPRIRPEDVTPAWAESVLPGQSSEPWGDYRIIRVVERRGWPLRMLHGRWERIDRSPSTATERGLPTTSGFVIREHYRRPDAIFPQLMLIPSEVLVVGMVLNTSIFACACLAAIECRNLLVKLIRKSRDAQGRCRGCGYDLQGSSSRTCPECGLNQQVVEDP